MKIQRQLGKIEAEARKYGFNGVMMVLFSIGLLGFELRRRIDREEGNNDLILFVKSH
ncbi:hypothetical protein AB4254_19300 [Vibrio breoganii]